MIDIIYQLKKNEANLISMNDELKERLASKEMKIEKSGSIAEAGISVKYVGTPIAPTREHWFVLTPR